MYCAHLDLIFKISYVCLLVKLSINKHSKYSNKFGDLIKINAIILGDIFMDVAVEYLTIKNT